MGGEKLHEMVRQKAGEDLAPTTFMTALADIPPEVFEKMCPPEKTILLGMTAKSILAILHKFPLEQRLPASVTLKKNAVPLLWSDPSTIVVAKWCRTTLNLSGCYIRAAGAARAMYIRPARGVVGTRARAKARARQARVGESTSEKDRKREEFAQFLSQAERQTKRLAQGNRKMASRSDVYSCVCTCFMSMCYIHYMYIRANFYIYNLHRCIRTYIFIYTQMSSCNCLHIQLAHRCIRIYIFIYAQMSTYTYTHAYSYNTLLIHIRACRCRAACKRGVVQVSLAHRAQHRSECHRRSRGRSYCKRAVTKTRHGAAAAGPQLQRHRLCRFFGYTLHVYMCACACAYVYVCVCVGVYVSVFGWGDVCSVCVHTQGFIYINTRIKNTLFFLAVTHTRHDAAAAEPQFQQHWL